MTIEMVNDSNWLIYCSLNECGEYGHFSKDVEVEAYGKRRSFRYFTYKSYFHIISKSDEEFSLQCRIK
jgi:hypothetical protein